VVDVGAGHLEKGLTCMALQERREEVADGGGSISEEGLQLAFLVGVGEVSKEGPMCKVGNHVGGENGNIAELMVCQQRGGGSCSGRG
jgi:hypothetical protein